MDTLTSRFTNCSDNEGIGFYYTYNGKGNLVRIEMKSFILAQKRSNQRDVALPRELSVRQLRSCLPKETYSTSPQPPLRPCTIYDVDFKANHISPSKTAWLSLFCKRDIELGKTNRGNGGSIKDVNYILFKSAECIAIYFKTILPHMIISTFFASITPFLPRKLHLALKP